MSAYELECYAAGVLFVVFLLGSWYAVWGLLERVMVPRIFISYRRKDRPEVAGRIYRELEAAYGEGTVIFDVSTQEGLAYDEVLGGGLASSDIIIAMIGPHWDGREKAEDAPRILLRNDDWVRREVRHGLKPPNNLICVRALGPKDKLPPDVPKYTKTQLDAWGATSEERTDLGGWLEEFRKQTALTVVIDEADNLGGFNELKSRIDRRHQGTGRRWLIGWKWGGGLLITALAVILIRVVAPGVADIRPLAEERKKATDELTSSTKSITDNLTERADQTKETLDGLDGVYINPLPLEQFIQQVDKDNPGGDLMRYRYQYVCWHMKLSSEETTPDQKRKYLVKFAPFGKLPDGVKPLTIRAEFNENEFNQRVKDKKRDASMYVSGRIHNVSVNEVLLEKCRVVVGCETEPPRKNP